VAIWARVENPSFSRMCWTWFSAVRTVTTSASAIRRLVSPARDNVARGDWRGAAALLQVQQDLEQTLSNASIGPDKALSSISPTSGKLSVQIRMDRRNWPPNEELSRNGFASELGA
jgi:hypothetical protein